MSKNTITLDKGGNKTVLKFDNGTIDVLGDLTELENPMSFVPNSNSWKDIKAYATTILQAAYTSGVQAIEKEEVVKWIKELSPEDVYAICTTWANMINPPKLTVADGEVGTDTRAANLATG